MSLSEGSGEGIVLDYWALSPVTAARTSKWRRGTRRP